MSRRPVSGWSTNTGWISTSSSRRLGPNRAEKFVDTRLKVLQLVNIDGWPEKAPLPGTGLISPDAVMNEPTPSRWGDRKGSVGSNSTCDVPAGIPSSTASTRVLGNVPSCLRHVVALPVALLAAQA